MPSMISYKQGDVLLVPFPFTDQSGQKQRPAVVVSGNAYNQVHPDLIMAPITSQIRGAADETEVTAGCGATQAQCRQAHPIVVRGAPGATQAGIIVQR